MGSQRVRHDWATNTQSLVYKWGIWCWGTSQVALVVKNLPANAVDIRDLGSVPGLGRSLGGGHGNPLQYSCLQFSPLHLHCCGFSFSNGSFPSTKKNAALSHIFENIFPDLKNSSGYCCIFLISFASKLLEAFSYSSPLPLLTSSLEPTPPNLCHYGSYQWPLCCHFNGTSPLPQWFTGKEPTCQCRRCGFDPSVRKISWSRKWQLTPVFLSGKSHR